MPTFDIVLILIIAGFVFHGLFFGLIRAIGSILGILTGLWLAKLFYLPVYHLLENLFLGNQSLGQIVVFIVLFIIINRLVGFGVAIIDSSYNILAFIPFLKTINRLAGALFGLVEGGLIAGLVLYGITQYPSLYKIIEQPLKNSQVAPHLLKFAQILVPLLPQVWERISSWINRASEKTPTVNIEELRVDKVKGWFEAVKERIKEMKIF